MACRKLDRDEFVKFFWFFCEISVLSLVGVVLWLSLTPRNPRFTISDAHFPALSSSLVVNMQIFNPNNHMGIDYSSISLKLYAGNGNGNSNGNAVVGADSTSAFYQGYKNTTVFHFQMPIQATKEFWNATPNMDFIVRVETAFRFRIIKWQTKVHHVAHQQRFTQ